MTEPTDTHEHSSAGYHADENKERERTLKKHDWLLAVGILLQLLDFWFTGFDRSGGFINYWFVASIIVALLFGFILPLRSDRGTAAWLKQSGIYLIVFQVMIWLPWGINKLTVLHPSYYPIYFVYAFAPPLCLLAMFDPECEEDFKAYRFRGFYVVFWLLILLASIVGVVGMPVVVDSTQANAGLGMKMFTNSLLDKFESIFTKVIKPIKSFNVSDPFFYTGQVEQNSDKPLGVTLEDVKSTEEFYVQGGEVTLWGYVSMESFLHDSLYVIPNAKIARQRENFPAASCTPPVAEVFHGGSELIECTFPPLNADGTLAFPAGSYPVEMSVSFPFETWADITYTFVSEEKARNYARLQRDIFEELDINEQPTAVYTSGPIMIGMGGSRMPILVTNTPPYLKNAYIGITIQNDWVNGQLDEVGSLELKLPKGFLLPECDRRGGDVIGPLPDPNVENYNRYVFRNVVNSENAFTSVRCKLVLESPDVLSEVFGGADKALRTFVATANYSYTIKEKTNFMVVE